MYGRRAIPVSLRTWLGLITGFVGVAVLLSAHGFDEQANIGWQLAMLSSALCWALSSMVIRESHSHTDPLAFTACYVLVGGTVLTAIGLARGDAAHWVWSAPGLGAIVFLAIVSSTRFRRLRHLLRHEPPHASAHAYVNRSSRFSPVAPAERAPGLGSCSDR
jgi:hypothetical protein